VYRSCRRSPAASPSPRRLWTRAAAARLWWTPPLLLLASLTLFTVLWRPLAAQGLTGPSLAMFASALGGIAAYVVAAFGLRTVLALLLAWRRGGLRRGVGWRPPLGEWAWDGGWLLAGHALLAMTYSWCKLYLPAYGGGLWDARLAALDTRLHLGVNPNVFALTIFSQGPPWAAKLLDAEYSVFVPTMLAGAAWFLVHPRREARQGFAAGFWLVWAVGLVGYIAMPALGPALAFEGLRGEVGAVFPIAARYQLALQHNYSQVVRMLADPGREYLIGPALGVAAMPSLHVAAHAFLALWAAAVGSALRTPLLLLALLTFVGSVATGWHYAVDSWAGLLLAGAAFLLVRKLLVPPPRPASAAPEAGAQDAAGQTARAPQTPC
jgi:hypothetical protein